jgi:uncharacterized membrane protein YphA (DoxX/SURF4 family)
MSASHSTVPTLLEVQRALRRSLVEHDDSEAAGCILADGLAPEARLNVYRNTFIGALTTALRLAYPAVHRLVGPEFFEGTTRIFIEKEPPRGAYLDGYGSGFPEFLALFRQAASLTYLPDVARLEWAVSRALHAPDVEALDLSRLVAVDPADYGRIAFVPHPSVGLVQSDCPADTIWRAVLAQDDAVMAAIDLGSGPVWLMVQRFATGVEVARFSEQEWRFANRLCAGQPLQKALDDVSGFDASAVLAGHLAAGRFTGFRLERHHERRHPDNIVALASPRPPRARTNLARSRALHAARDPVTGRRRNGILGLRDDAPSQLADDARAVRDRISAPLHTAQPGSYMAVAIELSTPPLLVLGLMTRPAAAILLGMTTVIEVFVYPLAWPTHIQWAAMLLVLLCRGPGKLAVDLLIRRRLVGG